MFGASLKKRILYWTEVFWPSIGGVEVLSAQLLPAMQERGYEFIIVTSRHDNALSDEDEWNGIPLYRFDFQTTLASQNLKGMLTIRKRLADLKHDFKPDLVHIQYADPSVFFHLQTKMAHPAANMLTVEALLYGATGADSLQTKAFNAMDWVVTPSQAVLDDTLELMPAITDRSSVIHPGSIVPAGRGDSPLSFDPPRLLCLGRLVKDKGFDTALNAYATIVRQFPEARLVVSGDGPERAALEQQATDLGVAESVEFTGWVTDQLDPTPILDLICSASVVMMPSRWREPFGLVALQGSQMGRPVVASRTGGLQEIIVHEETGRLFEKDNSQELANAVIALLADPVRAKNIGEAARRRANEMFGWDRFVSAHDELYQRLINQHHGD